VSNPPYLKENRLQDVIAAIQTMSSYKRSSLSGEDWAELISGNKKKGKYWNEVFKDHSEFFRCAPEDNERYALVWRRALPRLFHRRLMRQITEAELERHSST
jgi:hypothetical protein